MTRKRAISSEKNSASNAKASKDDFEATEGTHSGELTAMNGNDTHGRIIEAARRLFAREGYREVTTKQLAAEAGVNEITLFRKFRSKENILRAVFDFNMKKAEGILDKNLLLEKDADFVACLRGVIRDISNQAGDLSCMVVSFRKGKEMPLVAASMESLVRTMNERMCRFFDYHMEEGNIRRVNPMTLSMIFFGFMASSNMPKMPTHRMGTPRMAPPPFSVNFDEFIDLIMNGIKKQK